NASKLDPASPISLRLTVSCSLSQGYESPPDRKKKLRHACSNQINRMTPPERTTSRTNSQKRAVGRSARKQEAIETQSSIGREKKKIMQTFKAQKKKRKTTGKKDIHGARLSNYIKQEKK
ncbi:hypothetical protein T310_8660, partial [Rasamsonia emersonii CBS 393.64]